MLLGNPVFASGILIGAIVLIITLVIQYFIMKAVVRNGTIEAHDKLQSRPIANKTEKKIWLCPECKTDNPSDVDVCKKCEYSLR